ncbi:MAG: phytanoyl-CoA dioxygenase family protein [Planctomycetota bacterium]
MQTLTDDYELAADDRAAFLNDGFVKLTAVADHDELNEMRAVYDRMFDETAADSPYRKQLGGRDASGREQLPQILRPHEVAPELIKLRYWTRIGEIAKAMFGPDTEMRSSHAILKPAGFGIATPWHQDQAYHRPTHRYRNINFWLPLDAVTVEGGCMQYVRQTHAGSIIPHQHLDPDDKQTALVAQDQDFWQANATAVPLERGDVALHHSYCLHAAGPNHTDVPRRALIVVFEAPPVELDQPWVYPWQA